MLCPNLDSLMSDSNLLEVIRRGLPLLLLWHKSECCAINLGPRRREKKMWFLSLHRLGATAAVGVWYLRCGRTPSAPRTGQVPRTSDR